MKSVLISVKPKWCEKIVNGEKTIEVRKSAPKEVPFKAYIYETYDKKYDDIGICWGKGKCFEHGCKKVIGEFICDKTERFNVGSLRSDDIEKLACLSYNEMINYFYKPEELDGKTVKQGFAWHISDLKIYDKPKELSEFYRICKNPCKPSTEKILCLTTKSLKMNGYDGKIPLTRPPQSWQYVEELK